MTSTRQFFTHTRLQRITSSPNWIGPFLTLATLSVLLHFLLHPHLVRATLAHLPLSATPDDKAAVAQALTDELPLRLLFLPVRLLVGWSAFALLLFGIGVAFRLPERLHFVKVFALEVRAEAFNILAQYAALFYLLLTGRTQMRALEVPFSVAMLVPSNDIVLFSLLNSLNLFTLCYLILLTWGISVQSGCWRTKAVLIVCLTWSLWLLFHVGTTSFLREALHLLV